MKKEQIVIVILALLGASYVLDFLAGPIALELNNPAVFLTHHLIFSYPFTAISVTLRALAVYVTVLLIFSYLKFQYTLKASIIFGAGVLVELFAIQQLAVGPRTTTIQWILSLSLVGVLSLTLVIYYLIKALAVLIHKNINQQGPINRPVPPMAEESHL